MLTRSNTMRAGLAASAAIAALCVATPALAQADSGGDAAQDGNDQTVIVTAQRRAQQLFDVSQSISVVSEETLERQAATSFIDYSQLVPGFTLTQENPGETRLILRGLNTGAVGSMVATYVDDVPFGASGSLSNAAILAGDFDTFDVARIEVLRGPQGTLYGANAMGGVLKFITALPSTDRIEARAQVGAESVRYGEMGYTGNAMINLPLSDSIAFRASGFYRDTGGYVDAPDRNARNVNSTESYGARASLLFNATEQLSIRLFGLIQRINTDSASSFTANPRTLDPVDAITGLPVGESGRERYERIPDFNRLDYRLYSGTINYDFGAAILTSVSSYSEQTRDEFNDTSTNAARGLAAVIYGAAGPVGLAFENDVEVEKFTQEVRLQSPDSDRFEWLIGGYYTDERTALIQEFFPFNLNTQALIPTPGTFSGLTFSRFVFANIDATYEEIAAFASATIKFGPRFEISVGGRYSHNDQTSVQQVIQLGNGAPQNGESSEGVFTWSVAPRYEINDNVALYGRIAKGYRPGGPNFIPLGAPAGFPAEFNSDSLVSYELGIRGQTADRSVAFDGSIYYVDWSNILILSTANSAAGPVGVNSNGGRARSLGAELSLTVRPARGLTFVGTGAYVSAKLLDDTLPPGGGLNLTGGLAGDELPYTPSFTGNISVDYEWTLGGTAEAYVGANIRYVGEQTAGFSAAYRTAFGRRIEIDGYETVDLRAGIDFGRFSVSAYVRNLFDAYGVTSAGGYPFTVPAAIGGQGVPLLNVSTIRPRTFGINAGVRF
jgi:outer membrane receptor protein involved in Fe transport